MAKNEESTPMERTVLLGASHSHNLQDARIANMAGDGVEATQEKKPAVSAPDKWFGVRHAQTFMMFSVFLVSYALRVNLSVAIVAMVDKDSANPNYEEFDWDEQTQALLLSSFFWGYVVTQIPAGPLVERFGAKVMMTQAMIISSTFAVLTPVAATGGGWQLVCGMRVLQGLSQGCITPCVHTLLANWAPAPERGRHSTWAYSGGVVGTIVTLPLCGFLAVSSWGWPSTFYVFGALGFAWTALFLVVGSNSPAEHRSISKEEKEYILDSVGVSTARREDKPAIPWKSIVSSPAVWAIVFAHCGQYWGFWTLLTEMPRFMQYVLNFDLKSSGVLSALPYLCQWILSFFFGWTSDVINKKQVVTLSTSRKIYNSLGHWGPAVALIGLGYTSADNPSLAVAMLCVAVAVNAATYVGFTINHIDISPNYAGTLMGITNCFGNCMSIIAPLVVGAIVIDKENVLQWRIVFFIAAAVYFVANLVFVLFAKAEIQPWNDPAHVMKLSSETVGTKQETGEVRGSIQE